MRCSLIMMYRKKITVRLPEMPQPANFGGFNFNPASNLLAYRAVTAAICQRSPQPLRELPILANGLDAES
jgi:hypothetical protein